MRQVNVGAAQLGQLPEPQPAPRGEHRHQPQPVGHGHRDHFQLFQRRGPDPPPGPGLTGAPDAARARRDQVIGGGGPQHRAEQPVGVRPHHRGPGVEPGVPGPHGGRCDRFQLCRAELGQQQPVQDAPVVVLGAGLEAALGQPPGGVGGERLGPGAGVAPGARVELGALGGQPGVGGGAGGERVRGGAAGPGGVQVGRLVAAGWQLADRAPVAGGAARPARHGGGGLLRSGRPRGAPGARAMAVRSQKYKRCRKRHHDDPPPGRHDRSSAAV